jgi:protein-S-isoprenylcysteine O-methyltransferase Ste14
LEVIIANRIALFVFGTLFFMIVSKNPLKNVRSHGFYRFFVFEGILTLVCLNLPFWFYDPLSYLQLLSWFFLSVSAALVFQGLYQLKTKGGSRRANAQAENFAFENTTRLVVTGTYKYIRHPMYSSLLFLALGTFLKHISPFGGGLVVVVCACLLATAKIEETENCTYFGPAYSDYMKRSRMFIPFFF